MTYEEREEIISIKEDAREENVEVHDLVEFIYYKLINSDEYDEEMEKAWRLYLTKNGNEEYQGDNIKYGGYEEFPRTKSYFDDIYVKLSDEDDDTEVYSITNFKSQDFFLKCLKRLDQKVIGTLRNYEKTQMLSYSKIGKLILIAEIINDDFDFYEENCGITDVTEKVKEAMKIFRELINGNVKKFSEEEFIEKLKKLDEEGE